MKSPMKVDGVAYRTIWRDQDGWSVHIIDQTTLPRRWEISASPRRTSPHAIGNMQVRGAPLIGATAA